MDAPTGQPSLMTSEDVSSLLGVPVTTLYAWRSGRKGPRAIRVGRHLRYRRSDIEAWLEQQADPIPAA